MVRLLLAGIPNPFLKGMRMPEVLTRDRRYEVARSDRRWIGTVAGFTSEWWPTSNRNGGRLRVGIRMPAMLPGPVAPHVASVIMAKPLWQAGMSIMKFDSKTDWDRVAAADEIFQANQAKVAACQAAATRTGKDQTCTITVGPSRK